jgi:hypothetical protein
MLVSYKANDDGRIGKAAEKGIKAVLHLTEKVAGVGRTDLRKGGVCYEVKTGAGELGCVGGKLIKGSSMVIYIPVVDENATIARQEGFVMSRELFLDILGECGMIREKTATDGSRKITIQTFWNRKQNKPHGKGLDRMLEAFYNAEGVQTLEEWLYEIL